MIFLTITLFVSVYKSLSDFTRLSSQSSLALLSGHFPLYMGFNSNLYAHITRSQVDVNINLRKWIENLLLFSFQNDIALSHTAK